MTALNTSRRLTSAGLVGVAVRLRRGKSALMDNELEDFDPGIKTPGVSTWRLDANECFRAD